MLKFYVKEVGSNRVINANQNEFNLKGLTAFLNFHLIGIII